MTTNEAITSGSESIPNVKPAPGPEEKIGIGARGAKDDCRGCRRGESLRFS